ncbi:hypothetical protein KFU94_20900 [Chloroflexi bacterium TSY]|nr:hypothetical protein [Chloroflexi bacterium TSY]
MTHYHTNPNFDTELTYDNRDLSDTPTTNGCFSQRVWKGAGGKQRFTRQPDLTWTVLDETVADETIIDEEVHSDPAHESRFSENLQLQADRTPSGVRRNELLLISILMFGVIGYLIWQEAKVYALSPENPITAVEDKVSTDQTADTAQPTTAAAPYLGDMHTLETDYFHLTFYRQNAPAVEAVTVDLDALLQTLHDQVGLARPSASEKLTILVLPDVRHYGRTVNPFKQDVALLVPSPTLLPLPTTLTESDVLRSEILRHLTSLVLFQKVAPTSSQAWSLDPNVQGLLRWFAAQDPVQRAMLTHLNGVNQPRQRQLAENPSPSLVDLSQRMRETRFYSAYWAESHLRRELERQAMTIEAIVGYGLATYGQAHLPRLLEAIQRQEAWTEIVPQVFGVSAESFERGWHQYLLKSETLGWVHPNSLFPT